MSVAIEVFSLAHLNQVDPEGAAWIRESLAVANAILEDHGLATFVEPESSPNDLPQMRSIGGFPYSHLYTLHLAYSRARLGLTATIEPEDVTIERVAALLDSHLLCHNIAAGFYVPVDFQRPITDSRMEQSTLGSSIALLRELRFVAPTLGIALDDTGQPSAAALEGLRNPQETDHEKIVWYRLFEAASVSQQYGTAISFE